MRISKLTLCRSFTLILCLNLSSLIVKAQINFTANDKIQPYNGSFRAGVNFDIYRGFSDEDLATIAAGDETRGITGLSAKALRPGFFENFAELFGYDSRINAFKLYDSLGLKDNTMIIGFPSEEHRDPTFHCAGVQSTVFKNMELPIWDNGENGTPVNDNNYYALYIWKTATRYKNYVKFWEVWNEPGFDFTGGKGWLPKGAPGSWWENNPEPCDYKLRAPIFSYVRLLRISYEVIKSVDPNAYVVTSGLGYPSFLDAVLRNSDNPDGGKLTTTYPNKGGAYFDGIGYHAYPHFDDALRKYSDVIQDFVYSRHSDAAAVDPGRIKNQFEDVLKNYGYTGVQYPKKLFLITESNLPRKEFGSFIGSSEAQKNFMIKAFVNCVKNDIMQFHVFKLAEETDFNSATYEFDVMGLYKKINYTNKTKPEITEGGIAFKTGSQILFGLKYDSIKTKAMLMPATVDGGAFKDANGIYTFVLWAKTTTDKSEVSNATYSFPASFALNDLIKREWNFSITRSQATSLTQNIALTGTPIFFTESKIKASQQFVCEGNSVQFDDLTPSVSRTWSVQILPTQTVTETGKSFSKTFSIKGKYIVSYVGKDATGNEIAKQSLTIDVEKAPTVDFEAVKDQQNFVKLKSLASANATEISWSFSDGSTGSLPQFTKVFYQGGTINITLTAKNRCGSPSASKAVAIIAPAPPKGTTANQATPQYLEAFRAGVNMNFTPGWTDEQIADIAAGNLENGTDGVGAKTLRTTLPEYFTKFWGADVRTKTFQHFGNLDMKNVVMTLGYPDSAHRDQGFHCYREQSFLFKNMYLDIWDSSKGGNVVNESNYFAKYVSDLVKIYKNEVKFWEIWDTPGWDYEGKNGWKPRNWQQNWWENNPDPCELGMQAPVQHLVRMMRIAYEVIKQEDPNAFVVFSGSGFASFLDAVSRNSDNPEDGKVTPQYPNGGAAYFDAILYNVFPHFDGSLAGFEQSAGKIVYKRHSDAAVQSIANHKIELDSVMKTHGYDGVKYPKKQYLIGEINVPRKPLGSLSFGSDEVQKNFILKSYVAAVTNGILSMTVKNISESEDFSQASDASQVMGLYQKLPSKPLTRQLNIQGFAFKSISEILYSQTYDDARTKALNLTAKQRGAAFKNANGKYSYVLWAATDTDMQEYAKDSMNLPNSFNISTLYKREWSFSIDKKVASIASKNIQLSGTPIFLSEDAILTKPPVAAFGSDAKKICPPLTVKFDNKSTDATAYKWTFAGGSPATSTEATPSVSYTNGGKFDVFLEVTNAQGKHINKKIQYVDVDTKPKADFTFSPDSNGFVLRFQTTTTNSFSLIWDFGDGSIPNQTLTPFHRYAVKKIYTIRLIAVNDCGRDTIFKTIDLRSVATKDEEALKMNFQCFPNPFEQDLGVQFTLNESSKLSLQIYDTQGRLVQNVFENTLYTEGSHRFPIDLKTDVKGILILRLKTEKAVVYKQVVRM
jgi:PKD repeat protein